jgi:hypothetical protein
MGAIPSWVEVNWFNLIQTVGIMASLLLTAAAMVREAKAKEVENLLAITDHHRELWTGAYQRPELERVFQTNADVVKTPIKVAEEEFLNLVLVQYQMTWCIAKAGGIVTLKELATDMREFFSLPLPLAVWEKTKGDRNPQFVRFVEKSLPKSERITDGQIPAIL